MVVFGPWLSTNSFLFLSFLTGISACLLQHHTLHLFSWPGLDTTSLTSYTSTRLWLLNQDFGLFSFFLSPIVRCWSHNLSKLKMSFFTSYSEFCFPDCFFNLPCTFPCQHVIYFSLLASDLPHLQVSRVSLSLTISWSLLTRVSIESVMPSNDLLCHPFSPAFNLSLHQGLFSMSWGFPSGGLSIGASASALALILPVNIQG